MTTIADFKSKLAGGGARANQFKVSLIPPAAVSGGATAGRDLEFLCKAASLPQSIISDIPVMYRGRAVHMAGEREFQPWVISVYNDTTFSIRDAFESWNHLILNYNATNGKTTPLDYQVDATVFQLDRNDAALKSYSFKDMYPVEVGPIQLEYGQNNDIETFDITLVFNYFEPLRVTGV